MIWGRPVIDAVQQI